MNQPVWTYHPAGIACLMTHLEKSQTKDREIQSYLVFLPLCVISTLPPQWSWAATAVDFCGHRSGLLTLPPQWSDAATAVVLRCHRSGLLRPPQWTFDAATAVDYAATAVDFETVLTFPLRVPGLEPV